MQKNVTHIVIDETNCVVEWGDGCGKKFREIKLLRYLFPSATMWALTATATIKMREEIATHPTMNTPTIIAVSYYIGFDFNCNNKDEGGNSNTSHNEDSYHNCCQLLNWL